MELIDTSKNCEECSTLLKGIYWYCRNCEKFLCYDCIDEHNEEDIVALRFIEPRKAKLLPISYYGGGPTEYEWTTFPKNEFIEKLKLCLHALDYLDANKVVFHCGKCNELLCPECVEEHEKHEDHYILPYVLLNDKMTIRMVHPQFYPARHVNITIKGPKMAKMGENIVIMANIKNESIKPIEDIKICILNISKQDKFDSESNSKDWYIELHYPKYVILEKEKKIDKIEPKKTKEITFHLQIPKDSTKRVLWKKIGGPPNYNERTIEVDLPINNPFTIYTMIFYRNILNDYEFLYAEDLEIKLLD